MSNIMFNCPECNGALQVDSEGAGMEVECPRCQKTIRIPEQDNTLSSDEIVSGEAVSAPPDDEASEMKSDSQGRVAQTKMTSLSAGGDSRTSGNSEEKERRARRPRPAVSEETIRAAFNQDHGETDGSPNGDLFSAHGRPSTQSFIDRFLARFFGFARIASAFIAALSLVVIVIAAGVLAFNRDGFEVPAYDEEQSAHGDQDADSKYVGLAAKREMEDKLGNKVEKMVKRYSLSAASYDILINDLIGMDDRYRSSYISGFDRFLRAAERKGRKQSGEIGTITSNAANMYRSLFWQAVAKHKARELTRGVRRTVTISVIGGALFVFIWVLIIPLLVQIERNTAK